MKKELTKRTTIILLIVILLIGVATRIYVGFKKEYFHIDEAYSYSLMNYDKIQITENDDFYGNWHTKDYYIDYLSIGEDEKWDLTPVYENQKNDVHPPLYYLLLRIAASFTIGEFTKWTGIILNIIISVVSSILVYLISKQIFKNNKLALLTCLVSSLSMGALDTTAYIRMYELANFFVLLITYLHLKVYNKEDAKIKDFIFIGIAALLGSLTHYYVIVYTVFMFIIFVVKYIRAKEYKELIKYVGTLGIAAIISLVIFPHSLTHMFGGYRGEEAKGNLLNIESIFSNLAIYIFILSKNIFGGVAIIAICGYIVLYFIKRKEMVSTPNKELNLILIPTVLYFILVAQISSYKELRYIMPVISTSMICTVYMFYKLFKQFFDEKKSSIATVIVFGAIIISPLLANMHLDFTYTKMNHLADRIEEKHDIPALYIFNENNIRFLDDIYIFTKLDESYIMKYSETTIKNIKDVLKNKDTSNGLIVVTNEGVDVDKIIKEIADAYNYKTVENMQNLNAGMVKYLK